MAFFRVSNKKSKIKIQKSVRPSSQIKNLDPFFVALFQSKIKIQNSKFFYPLPSPDRPLQLHFPHENKINDKSVRSHRNTNRRKPFSSVLSVSSCSSPSAFCAPQVPVSFFAYLAYFAV